MFSIPKILQHASLRKIGKCLIKVLGSIFFNSGDILVYILCFFKPLVQSIKEKRQNEKSTKQEQQEYSCLREKIQRLEQRKNQYEKQVKSLREEISWSRDYLSLSTQGKDVTYLEQSKQKLEKNWNLTLEQDDDCNDSDDQPSE